MDDERGRDGAAGEVIVSPRFPRGSRPKLLPVATERRPATRAECRPGGWNVERPCPFATCPHHLVHARADGLPPWEMTESCSLDVAERNGRVREDGYTVGDGAQLEEIGDALGLTGEGVNRIVTRALLKLRMASPSPDRLGAYVVPDELAPDVVAEFQAGAVDEDATMTSRIERAVRGNPEENDRTIGELVGVHRKRVAEVRNRLGLPAASGVGSKS